MNNLQKFKELKDLLPQLEEMKEEIIKAYKEKEKLDLSIRKLKYEGKESYRLTESEKKELDKEILSKFQANKDKYKYWKRKELHTPWASIFVDFENLINEKILNFYTDEKKSYCKNRVEAYIKIYKDIVNLFEEKYSCEEIS